MDTNKNLDLAAGRLAKIPTRHGTPRPHRKGASSYGTARLGITPEAEIQEPEVAEVAPAITALPAKPEPLKAKLNLPKPIASRPDPSPAAMVVADSMGRFQSLITELREHIHRRWALAAAAGAVATIGIAWLAFSGGPEQTLLPQTPARAHAAAAPAKPQARPATVVVAPKPVAPEPVPVVVAREQILPEPATPDPVTPDDPAPTVHPGGDRGNRRLSARTASLLSSLLTDAREAWPHGKASPAAPVVKSPEPPKPEKVAAPKQATYAYVPCPPGFRFTGAVLRPGATFANINGRFVPVGGKVGGAKVVEINTSSAVMEMDGKRFVVCYSMTPTKSESNDEDDEGKDDDDQTDKPAATTQPAARAALKISLGSTQAA